MFNHAPISFLRLIPFILLLAWSNKFSAQGLFSLNITGPTTCVEPKAVTTYTGSWNVTSNECTMLLWTIEPGDAGKITIPGVGPDHGGPCLFVAEEGCGHASEMPVFEGDIRGCGENVMMPYASTSHTVTVRWVKKGKLKLKLKEKGVVDLTAELAVDVLPRDPIAININSSSNSQVSMTATFPAGPSCSNLRFRWRVSTCGGAFGAPIETSTPSFTLSNNFCNCSAVVKVSSVVGTGANEVESTQLQRSFPRTEAPFLIGPHYLCIGSTTDFLLGGLPTSANWYVDGPAYIEYSDIGRAGIFLPYGNFSYGVNLGVSGTYGCGSYYESRFLTIPELPCALLPPSIGQSDRSVTQASVSNIKVVSNLLRTGEPIRVELPEADLSIGYHLTVIGIDGKVYQEINDAKGLTQIPTNGLTPGHYHVRIQNNQNMETVRFVIID